MVLEIRMPAGVLRPRLVGIAAARLQSLRRDQHTKDRACWLHGEHEDLWGMGDGWPARR
jgi:hypothetical protein